MTVSSTSTGTSASAAPTPEAATGTQLNRSERMAELLQRRGSLAALVLVCLVASLVFDSFATGANARNIAVQASFLAVVALGMTFVIITGGIDLSVGSVYALGGVLAAYGSQYGSAVALALALGAGAAIGLINGLLVTRGRLAPFIVTLATLLGARGLVLFLTEEGATTYLIADAPALRNLGQGTLLGIAIPFWIAIGLCALGTVLLQLTRFGQTAFAVGDNEDASRLMGLPVDRTKLLIYVMSGVLAAFAGAMLAARSSSGVPIVGVGFELDAIAAVVIGGTLLTGGAGTIGGTLAGVLLLQVIQNVINQIGGLSSAYQSVVRGSFLVVVVVLQTYLSRRQRL
jgi:ribose transport system permease protein